MNRSTRFILVLSAVSILAIIGFLETIHAGGTHNSAVIFPISSMPEKSEWTATELAYPNHIQIWSFAESRHDELLAANYDGIACYDGRSLRSALDHIDSSVTEADFNDRYFAYSVRPFDTNYQLKQELFISIIKRNGRQVKFVNSHKFDIPFSQSITGIRFLNRRQLLVTSFLEYGIVNIYPKSNGDFGIRFRHYPFLAYNTQLRLDIGEVLTDGRILIYGGLGVNLLQELPNGEYVVRNLFYFDKNPESEVPDESRIREVAMVDTTFGAFLIRDRLIYWRRDPDSGKSDFISPDYIRINTDDSISAGDIAHITLLNKHVLLCLTNNGLLLKQEIDGNNIPANHWKIITRIAVTNPKGLAVLSQDTVVVVDAKRLFLVCKKLNDRRGPGKGEPANVKPFFVVEPFVQPSSSYGVGIGDLENNGKNAIYLVDVYDMNKLFFSFPKVTVENNIIENLASQRGIGGRTSATKGGQITFDLDIGVAIGDINEDGAEDVILTNLAHSNSLYLNDGKGYFRNATKEYHFDVNMWRSECAVLGDVNNDGYLDVFNTSFFKSNRLFVNDHGISLDDKTKEYGLSSHGRSITAVFGDVNNDGYLDLYVGNWIKGNRLFINNGHGKFIDRTKESGVGCGDLKETNSVFFADLNNDGYLDLFVGNRAGGDKLFINNGNGTFTDVTKECGLGGDFPTYGAVFGDFENDGWQDIVIACLGGMRYFKNLGVDSLGHIHFKDITSQCFPPDNLFKAYNTGLAVADFGNKGLLDLVMNRNGGPTLFLSNRARLDGTDNYVSVKVEGDESNRDAIGANLRLYYGDSLLGYREVSGGFGYASSSSKIQHFGTGRLKGPFSLIVHFPVSGITRKIKVNANSFITVTEHTGLKRSYFLARKYMLRLLYGKGFVILGVELALLSMILIGLISFAETKLRLQKKNPKRISISLLPFVPSLAVFYLIKTISVESMRFYFGPAYFILDSTNLFTDELLPLFGSCVFAISYLLIKRHREASALSAYNVLDNLLTALKRFGHGEGMLIILYRLSLLTENLARHGEKDYDKEGLERIGTAYSEYKSAVHPEILRIHGLLYLLEGRGLGSGFEFSYSKIGDSLLSSDARISKGCELLLGNSPLKIKAKAREEVTFSIKNIKEGLGGLRSAVQLNFSVNVVDEIGLAIKKFQAQNPDLTIDFIRTDGRINAFISSVDLNEVLNIVIQNAVDELRGERTRSGSIKVAADLLNETALISIEDNGKGIPPDAGNRIFEPGFTTKPKGHGLGLSIARGCLEKYEGKISMKSGSSGGALFIIELKSI